MKNYMMKSVCLFCMFLASCTPKIDAPETRPENLVEIETASQTLKTTHLYGSGARECLVKAMYFEARGTGERGMRAVGEVVLNRADDSRFPSTACGVLNQYYNGTCQFSFICDGVPDRYREPNQKALANKIATTLLYNRGKDITNGALFFHAASMRPGWFGTLSSRGTFGRQLFYR